MYNIAYTDHTETDISESRCWFNLLLAVTVSKRKVSKHRFV